MKSTNKPLVGVIMGSDSDLPIMKDSVDVLEEFEIPYEVMILSAHRTPEETKEYAEESIKRGIKIIIAGAGGAAHLAGVVASLFPLPVIGIPIKTSTLNGIDSLYSIVQMPPGVPVATVAINGAKNASLLAIQILSVNDVNLQKKLIDYKNGLKEAVIKKSEKLRKLGPVKYLVETRTKL